MKILHLSSEYPPQQVYGLGRAIYLGANSKIGLSWYTLITVRILGGCTSTEWDSRGQYSFAAGLNCQATANYSTVWGNNCDATGQYSTVSPTPVHPEPSPSIRTIPSQGA